MLGIRLGIYWKFTWGFFIPISLFGIFTYSFINFRSFESAGYVYPVSLTASGWVLAVFALIQLPLWGFYAVYKQKKGSLFHVIVFPSQSSFPNSSFQSFLSVSRAALKHPMIGDQRIQKLEANGFFSSRVLRRTHQAYPNG